MIATRVAALAAGALAALACMAPAAAQVQLGGDDRVIGAALEQDGYDSVRIVKRDFTIVRTHACKGDKKYLVKVSILGKITSSTELGPCDLRPVRARISERELRRSLRRQGFEDIQLEARGNRTVAIACREGRRERLVFGRTGELLRRRAAGPCRSTSQAGLDEKDLRSIMTREGYDRVEIVDGRRAPFIMQGCKEGTLNEVTIGRRGRVRGERRVGRCAPRLAAADLGKALAKEGYSQVKVLRARAPFLVEACKGDRLLELSVSATGTVRSEDPIGRCPRSLTDEQLRAAMVAENMTQIELSRTDSGWVGTVCVEDERTRIQYARNGDATSKRVIGRCPVASALEMMRTLESRGATRTELQIEGCFQNRRYRWTFDRLGNRTGRVPVQGSC